MTTPPLYHYVWKACPTCHAAEGDPCTDLRYTTERWPLADLRVHPERTARRLPPTASTTPQT